MCCWFELLYVWLHRSSFCPTGASVRFRRLIFKKWLHHGFRQECHCQRLSTSVRSFTLHTVIRVTLLSVNDRTVRIVCRAANTSQTFSEKSCWRDCDYSWAYTVRYDPIFEPRDSFGVGPNISFVWRHLQCNVQGGVTTDPGQHVIIFQ